MKKVTVILTTFAALVLVILSFSAATRADTTNITIANQVANPTLATNDYGNVGNQAGGLNLQPANYPYSLAAPNLSTTQALATVKNQSSSFSSYNYLTSVSQSFAVTYNSGIQTSDGNITGANLAAIIKAANITVNGISLSQYVAAPFIVNGQNYAGYIESDQGTTAPQITFAVQFNGSPTSLYNIGNLFQIFSGWEMTSGNGIDTTTAWDFMMNDAQVSGAVDNWLSYSDSGSNMALNIVGSQATLTGNANVPILGKIGYTMNLNVTASVDNNNIKLTAQSVNVNGEMITSSNTLAAVLGAAFSLVPTASQFIGYTSGSPSFTLNIGQMPTLAPNWSLVNANFENGYYYYMSPSHKSGEERWTTSNPN